jgi:hypothetical protein
VPLAEIDKRYLDKPYYIVPDGKMAADLDGSVVFIGKSTLDLVRFRQSCSYLTARHKSSCQRDPHLFKSKGMRSSRSGESFDRKRQLFILLCFDLRPLETKVERVPKPRRAEIRLRRGAKVYQKADQKKAAPFYPLLPA